MKAVIIEDEERAANRLTQLLSEVDNKIEVIATMQTVREAVAYEWDEQHIDLIFLDIHLADGSSFEIFKQIDLDIPIIFTTAYDQYALDAFKVNSIDYLLKPITTETLSDALEKFHQRIIPAASSIDFDYFLQQLSIQSTKQYIRNLLVTYREKLIPVQVENFALFFIENTLVKGLSNKGELFILDQNLDELEQSLDPDLFYRANRQIILNDKTIVTIEPYFNSRLLVQTKPKAPFDILVSKAKARSFKNWVKGASR